MKMTTITLTNIKEEATSYTGFSVGNAFSTAVKVYHNGTNYLEKIFDAPIIPTNSKAQHSTVAIPNEAWTGKYPFHGHKSTSFSILPPVLILLRKNQNVPQIVETATKTSAFNFFKGNTAKGPQQIILKKRSKVFMLDAIFANENINLNFRPESQSIVGANFAKAQEFNNMYKAREIVYDPDLSNEVTVSSDKFFRGGRTLDFTEPQLGQSSNFVIFVDGDVYIRYKGISAGNVTVISTRNIIIQPEFFGSGSECVFLFISLNDLNYSFPGGVHPQNIFLYNGTSSSFIAPETTVPISTENFIETVPEDKVIKLFDNEQFTQDNNLWRDISYINEGYFEMVPNDNINREDLLNCLSNQFQYQYGVFNYEDFNDALQINDINNTRIVSEILYTNGEYKGKCSVCIEDEEGKLPNAGILTESFDFKNYHHVMAQTYKVKENFYAFGKSGRYMTISENCDVIFSPTDLVIESAYTAKDIFSESEEEFEVRPITVLTLNEFLPEEVGTSGGSDPFLDEWASKYRISSGGLTNDAIFIGGFYKSMYSYSPFGGKIKRILTEGLNNSGPLITRDYDLVNGELRLYNKYPSKSRALIVDVEIEHRNDLRIFTNVSENYPIPINSHYVTYCDLECIHLKIDHEENEVFSPIPADNNIYQIGEKYFRYQVINETSTRLSWATNEGDLNENPFVTTYNFNETPSHTAVKIFVIFSSMVNNIGPEIIPKKIYNSRIPFLERYESQNGFRGRLVTTHHEEEMHHEGESKTYLIDERFDSIFFNINFFTGPFSERRANENGYFQNVTGLYDRLVFNFEPSNNENNNDNPVYLLPIAAKNSQNNKRTIEGIKIESGAFNVSVFNEDHQIEMKKISIRNNQINSEDLPFILGNFYVDIAKDDEDLYSNLTFEEFSEIINNSQEIPVIQGIPENIRISRISVNNRIKFVNPEIVTPGLPVSITVLIGGIKYSFKSQ